MMIWEYSTQELNGLCICEPRMARAVALIGPLEIRVYDTLAAAFISTIIGQQLSSSAFEHIYSRFCARFAPDDLPRLAACAPDELRKVGISRQKAACLQNFAQQVCEGSLDLEGLRQLDDADVKRILLKLKGVGPWSAGMMLMFGLHRRNVMILEDLGIRHGLCLLHNLPDLAPAEYPHYAMLYSPYRTLACHYLWEIANRKLQLEK